MKKILFICLFIGSTLIYYSCGPSQVTVSNRPSQPYYARPASPGSTYVWVDGDWVVRNGRYRWREGHWVRTRDRVWIGGNWQPRGSGWYWRRGHWR